MVSRFYDRTFVRVFFMAIALMGALAFSTSASRAQEYTAQEIVDSGHKFFGATSGGLATVVEKILPPTACPMAICSAKRVLAR